MKKIALLALGLALARPAFATDSLNSELSHAGGGLILGVAATALANEVAPRHRALIGFGTSVAIGIALEANEKSKFSWLDAGAHIVGAAIGAYLTDGFILSPVVSRDGDGEKRVGLKAGMRF